MITKQIEIEELVNNYPFSVKYLMEQGIRCIACGEPIWGTLEEAAKEKNFDDAKIQQFVDELNQMALENKGEASQQNTAKIDVKPIED
jgi:methionine synthase II (cobalamin-independent)